jgi:hypothetical protein
MEHKEQTEIEPDPLVGGTVAKAKDEEPFGKATDVPVFIESRASSPVMSARQRMYLGLYGPKQETARRDGSAGVGQSTDPVVTQKPSKGNPFGEQMQVSFQPRESGNQSVPAFSCQMLKVEKVTKDNFDTWKVRMSLAAINAKCYAAFEHPRPNSYENAAAMTLLLNGTPELWHTSLSKKRNAHDALHWGMDQFDGGKNQFHVDELDREFQTLKMASEETYEAYAMRAGNLPINLESNAREVTHSSLVDKIVNGLPALFDTTKSSLRLLGRSLTLEDLCSMIKHEAYNLEIARPKGTGEKALIARLTAGNSQNQGRNRANGKPQQRKIKGNCWNCGRLGHSHVECRAPPSNFAFKPRRNDSGADSREEPIALITQFDGGNKGTWADLVDGQEWVVGSGASHHITGDPSVLHDYVEYAVPKPLATAVKTNVALLYGQGTVCMEGIDGTTFWLKDVQYAPGLTQSLYSMNAGNAQNFLLTMNTLGEFVSVQQTHGRNLCWVVKANTQYLLEAKALNGEIRKHII